jgi:hypothetical protein
MDASLEQINLQAAVDALRSAMTNFPSTNEHQLADFVLSSLATDVLEQSEAVLLLKNGAVPRATFANARAAHEAAVDMDILTADASRYDQFAAEMRVFELFEVERLHRRAPKDHARDGVEMRARVEEVDPLLFGSLAAELGRLGGIHTPQHD